MSAYEEFLQTKRLSAPSVGIDVAPEALNAALMPFQRDITRWALARGRAAMWEDCGLGKTIQQLDWARCVCEHTGRPVLILAPLAVSHQTAREGAKFGIGPVTVCRSQADVRPGINVTNYEMLPHFDSEGFGGMVLDEASILKSFDGVFRRQITEFGRQIGYRLSCTATPAPNDLIELTNQAEFLDVMTGKEIIALFFTQDGNSTHKFRLKGHAKADFWKWLATWAVALRKPSDLGYDDGAFVLPPLNMHQVEVELGQPTTTLFVVEATTLSEQRQARKDSLQERVAAAAALANGDDEPWLLWCDLNAESEALAKAIPGSVEVRGPDSPESKERALLGFAEGRIRVLITKPSIAGHGMNWQHCARVAFVGLSHSYEQLYQAIRRCWRFGQARPVECYVITSDAEGPVVRNIERKEQQASDMMTNLVQHMAGLSLERAGREEMPYQEQTGSGTGWTMHLGDSVETIDNMATESVGLSVWSPPFPGMYTYTNSPRDMGNVKSIEESIAHLRFLVGPDKLLRVTMPGRSCAVHLTQSVAFKGVDGYIGIKDFRGAIIRLMEDAGWIYYGECTIDKDPQVKAVRTKDRGLLFKTLANDSAHMHMALADYLLQFRKPGDNPRPIRAGISSKYDNERGWITNEEWIEWAAPVWYREREGYPGGIRETDVLNVLQARETDDERHLCPLQLGVIERAVKLWSAPGELVLDPFAGIGSTGYQAVKLNRQFVGLELKRSYFESACRNLRRAVEESRQGSLAALWEDETAEQPA